MRWRRPDEATADSYDTAIRPVRMHLGHKPVQELGDENAEAFIDWMVTEGRRRGGKPGAGLGMRSVPHPGAPALRETTTPEKG